MSELVGRYARQVVLPGFGAAGQERLHSARVSLVGAGGLGSPVAYYLAAAGVGALRIIDDDVVEASNLNRQILHGEEALGRPKAESARDRLAAQTSDVAFEAVVERVTRGNAGRLLSGFDAVVSATDNYESRYAICEAACALGIPHVWGAVEGLAGQFAVFGPEGPCYSCLFPAPPPAELIPPATQRGVLGAICGIVGSAMAAELLLWLLERRPEATRLVQLDLATGESRSLVAEARPGCRCQHETPDLRRSMPIKEPEKEEMR